MGTNREQAEGLIADGTNPVFYKLKLELSKIPEERILMLDNEKEWLYTILACRKQCKPFNNLQVARMWLKKIEQYDIIIGKIADDSMNVAMSNFARGKITDEALLQALKAADLGTQYVAKTQLACDCIQIVSENPLCRYERQAIRQVEYNKREQGKELFRQMKEKYKNEGKNIISLIKEEKQKEGYER